MSIEALKSIVQNSDNIVFFGGAGVSTESNIPDFRSETGLYKTTDNRSYPPEVMLSHSFFVKHPEDFFKFHREKIIHKDAKPNPAHHTLAELEKMGKLKAVITQNIDGLHQSAGSENVLELHGSIHKNYCVKCKKQFDLDYVINSPSIIPKCDACQGIVRPGIVLYEEGLDMNVLSKSVRYIEDADVLIVGGTSLVVYPAAGLVNHYRGNKLVLINKASTPYDNKANLVIHNSIGKVLENVL
jgi:NAD-dependent deacetylase